MDNELAQKVTELRESRGYSKARLARESHISPGYMTQIEQGARTPSETVLRRFAKALSVDPLQLLLPAGLIADEDIRQARNTVDTIRRFRKEAGDPMSQEEADAQFYTALDEALEQNWYTEHLVGPEDEHGHPTFESPIPHPEGWWELTDKDRAIVQKLINHLRYIDSED